MNVRPSDYVAIKGMRMLLPITVDARRRAHDEAYIEELMESPSLLSASSMSHWSRIQNFHRFGERKLVRMDKAYITRTVDSESIERAGLPAKRRGRLRTTSHREFFNHPAIIYPWWRSRSAQGMYLASRLLTPAGAYIQRGKSHLKSSFH